MKRSPIRRMSDKRRKLNEQRRAILHAAFGTHPRCALCQPLRERGVITGCDGWADDADEILRRSAGGSIVDVDNIRPVGRLCHRWIGDNHGLAREWGLVASRYGA